MNVIWIGVAAFVGGMVAALLGWLETQEDFDARKFGSSGVRALVAAILFAVGFNYTNHVTPIDIGWAFLGGAGIDVLGNRIAGSISARRSN